MGRRRRRTKTAWLQAAALTTHDDGTLLVEEERGCSEGLVIAGWEAVTARCYAEGTKLSLDRGQGHERLQRQEWDHVVLWFPHSDRVDSSCMEPKTKGASRGIHLISEKHLTKELRQTQLAEAKLRSEGLSTGQEDIEAAIGELDCFRAHIRLREPDKSEGKAESSMVLKR
ncbi:hypothetical protein B296_00012348 [Ensete ventricosum]|uniref:Uncharacterized protein n=1 Tax=Ensete ventricosum TaxID=4639 RepID=A0A427A389_ENSVE|nr:hypothetical protein B296_00012348 [Ensete ventricosum]